MSKRKDPKDEAIAYVMNAPLVEASTFVQTLSSVVKARAAQSAKANAAPATKAASRSTKAPVRDIRVIDPSKEPAQSAQPSSTATPPLLS
jgi:hypothetical protein